MTIYNLTATNFTWQCDGGAFTGDLIPGVTNLPINMVPGADWDFRITGGGDTYITIEDGRYTSAVVIYEDATNGDEIAATSATWENEGRANAMIAGLVMGMTAAVILKAIGMLKMAKRKGV